MTKFVLLGGYAHKAPDEGRSFYQELVKGIKKPIKVLMCYFARERGDWDRKFKEDVSVFSSHLPTIKIDFFLASSEEFLQQIADADIIYIKGGEMEPLFSTLKQIPRWETALCGKVVAGSSAGAYLLSSYYYDMHDAKIHEGVGLVPIKSIVHFESDYYGYTNWQNALENVKAFHPELETVALREGEFRVFIEN